MRKIFNILIILFTLASAVYGQDVKSVRLSYKSINKPLPVVLTELSKASGINIIFSETKFKIKKNVTISANNERLIDVLTFVLEPSKLTYEIIDNYITIVNARDKDINEEFIISGFIKDAFDKEVLPYSTAYLKDHSNGVFANEKGYYSLKLKRGTYSIVYAYVGYKEDTISIFLESDTIMTRQLKNNTQISEITIEEDLSKVAYRYGEDFLSKDRIKGAQYFGGEADVIKAVNLLPGVSTGADGFGGMSIRGGNYDQNLILFDGVPVQNTGHGFGLISIFNSNIIQDARLIKSAFPARYGGRLSSVLDIKTKDGNKSNFEGEVSLSTIASKAHIEGPIAKNKASFLLSYRRTFADPWIKSVSTFINESAGSEGSTAYSFDDINAKINVDLNKNHQISLSYYKGKDGLTTNSLFKKEPDDITYIDESYLEHRWGNSIASFHLNSVWGQKSFSKLIAYSSLWKNEAYNFNRIASDSANVIEDIYSSDYKYSNFNTKGIRWELDHQLNKKNLIRLGASYIHYEFQPKFQTVNNITGDSIFPKVLSISDLTKNITYKNYQSKEILFFAEDEISFQNVILNLGLHASNYSFDTSSRWSLQPRVSLQINGEKSWFNISASSLRQYQQIISENNLGFPSDLWLSSTNFIQPADALIGSAAFGFMTSKSFSFNLGAYYKKMKNLVGLSEGAVLLPDSNDASWQQLIDKGEGKAFGGELSVRYNTNKIDFENNFTVGNSTRLFQESNNGEAYNYKLNRSFMYNSRLNLRLSKRTELTSVFTYQTGSYVSFPSGGVVVREIDGKKIIYPIYEGKNNKTLPAYMRLDLGITFVSTNKVGTHKVFAGIYNIINRKNPIYLDIERNTFSPNVLEASQVSLFPILPSLSYSLSFGKRN